MHSTPTQTAGTNGEPLSSPEAVALHTTQSLHRVVRSRCTASSLSTTDTKCTPSSSSTTSPREQRACFPFRLYTLPSLTDIQVNNEFFMYHRSARTARFGGQIQCTHTCMQVAHVLVNSAQCQTTVVVMHGVVEMYALRL
jgi:hypothetical protein